MYLRSGRDWCKILADPNWIPTPTLLWDRRTETYAVNAHLKLSKLKMFHYYVSMFFMPMFTLRRTPVIGDNYVTAVTESPSELARSSGLSYFTAENSANITSKRTRSTLSKLVRSTSLSYFTAELLLRHSGHGAPP